MTRFTDALTWRNSSILPVSPQVDETANLARERLRANPYSQVRVLQSEFHEGLLVLRGSFPSDYHKQIAQEAICDIKCVEMIVNAVEVASRGVSRELSAAQCSPCRSLLHTGSDNMSGFQGRVSLSVDSGSIRFEFTSSGKIGSAFAASFSQDCC